MYFIAMIILTASCSNESERYILNCSSNKKNADSAYIYIYEKEYGALRLYDKEALKNGRVSFTGQVAEPKIAFLKLSNDTVPYYFILDNNSIRISLKDDRFILRGGNENNNYYRYLLLRQNIVNAKKSLWQKYEKYAGDSVLTDSIENALKLFNDKLTDSLENVTTDYIKTHDLGSEIIWRRFGNSLPDNKIQLLKR